jgi:hypothetical protein
MLRKPMGYDAAETMEVGTFRAIPPGWYPAVILNVAEGETPNGSPFIEFAVDIIDGEYIRYYKKEFDSQRPVNGEKRWRGTVRYFTTEKAVGMLKGAIKAIEESNPGYTFDWDEAKVKGKKVGLGIHREEYEATDGKIKTATRPYALCAIQKVISGEMPEPKDKPLDTTKRNSSQGYSSPNLMPPGYQTTGPLSAPKSAPSWESIEDGEELPF